MDRLTYWDEELGSYLLKESATERDAVNALGILEDENKDEMCRNCCGLGVDEDTPCYD